MSNVHEKMKNKKKILKAVGILLGILTVVLAAAALAFSANVGKQVAEGILYMNQENDTKGNSIKQLEKVGYDLASFEREYKGLAKEVTVTAEDGNRIPAEIFTCASDSAKTVILAHGQGGDHVVNYPMAEIYLRNNWNVITYDQRGAGDAGDKKVTFGYYERMDVKALVDYARDEMQSERIVVHGQSMGAATAALYAVTEHAEENIDAVVLDSCFDSMENMFLGVWRGMDGTEGIPEDYIVACGDWYLKKHYDFGFEDADVMEALKEDKIPTLLLQMKRDVMVPNETAEQMFENIVAEEKEICYFDSKHIEGITDDPEGYERAVFSFLEKD